MLLIYTGEGKGKTSATVGQTIRALGQDLRVAFAQFMKKKGIAGEQKMLFHLLGDNFFTNGAGFFWNEEDRALHRERALETLAWAYEKTAQVDILLLDEALYALGSGLLKDDELKDLIKIAKGSDTHLVLSGRGLPSWLEEEADLISYIQEKKHPYKKGIAAQKGIEF